MLANQYLILYPRSYNRRGTEDRHSIFGLTNEGQEVSVKLRAPKGGVLGTTVNDLAQSGIDARSPCIAALDNAPGEHQKGVLLFTDLSVEADGGYIARSVHVIRVGVEPILPVKGLGRLKIQEETRVIEAARERLRESDLPREEKDRLDGILIDPSHYQYSAIIYNADKSETLPMSMEWRERAAAFASRESLCNLLVRVFNPDKGVIHLIELTVNDDPVIGLESQWRSALKSCSAQWDLMEGCEISIMAFDEYPCSKEAARFYAQAYPWLKDLYYKDDMPALTEVIISLTDSPASDDLLLKMLFPLTKRVGMLRNLDATGQFGFGVRQSEDLEPPFKQGINYRLEPVISRWAVPSVSASIDADENEIVGLITQEAIEIELLNELTLEPVDRLETQMMEIDPSTEFEEDPFADVIDVFEDKMPDPEGDKVIKSEPSSTSITDSLDVGQVDPFGVAEDLKECLSKPDDENSRESIADKPMTGLAAFIAKRIG